jgi:epoxyqueuosine reductase
MSADESITQQVKQLAGQCGFARVGIAPAEPVASARQLNDWLAAGHHGGMAWMETNCDVRSDPRRLLDGARSVICLAVSYAPPREEPSTDAVIARYARGRDYHKVLKQRMHRLCDRLREAVGDFDARAFVDSAPLAERALAVRAGLGWIGRSGNLIVPGLGGYMVLGEIVTTLDLMPDAPLESAGCGDCRACLAACPTGALQDDATIDCRRCLSHATIEHDGPLPRELWSAVGSSVFGCDRCLAVCPHNRAARSGDTELTGADSPSVTLGEILTWSEVDWDAFTRGRALRRANYQQWLRNAVLAAGCSGKSTLAKSLQRLRTTSDRLADEIDWALHCLAPRKEL